MLRSLVGSEMCIRDSLKGKYKGYVDLINNTRNILAHDTLRTSITTKDFNKRWSELRQTFVLTAYSNLALFDDLKECSLDPCLNEKVNVIQDFMKFIGRTKCDKSDLDNYKNIVSSSIQDCKADNTKTNVKLENLAGNDILLSILILL